MLKINAQSPKKHLRYMAITLFIIVMIVASSFVVLHMNDDEDDFIGKPDHYLLEPFLFQDAESLKLNPDCYEGAPILASLVRNHDIQVTIDWGDGVLVYFDDLSTFSANIALTFWETPGEAIVVDSYDSALNMVPLATLKDIPIIVDGPNSNEALYRMGIRNPHQLWVSGDTRYTTKGVNMIDEANLVNSTAAVAQELGIELDYLTVVNPNDFNETYADVPHLSACGALLAAHHNSLILTVEGNSTELDYRNETANMTYNLTHRAYMELAAYGMEVRYICMVGDARSLPFMYSEMGPSDNPYADLDGNNFTVEIAIGRIVGKTLGDVSSHLDRIFHYEEYLATQSASNPQNPAMGPNWNNNGLVYCGMGAEFAGESTAWVNALLRDDGQFDAQDDSPQAHTPGINTEALTMDFARANYIMMDADHGNPYGTASFSSEDLKEMHPGLFFAVSCSLGRIDGVDISRSMTYTVLEKGMNIYIAALRTAYGSMPGGDENVATGLCKFFLEDILAEDLDVGTALMQAKNTLVTRNPSYHNDLTSWQFECFGDPAFNPYEPCHEGAS